MTGDCARCIDEQGLCSPCAEHDRSILPQLAQPPYVKLIANSRPRTAPITETPAEIPALGTPGRRLARALAGHFTRVKRSA